MAVESRDPWQRLRRLTPARIALGRAGMSLPTDAHLGFQLAHARARDAVHASLDAAALAARIADRGRVVIEVASRAADRVTYLQRPDLGRRLDEPSARLLGRRKGGARAAGRGQGARYDAAFVIADGLSALAVERNAPPLLEAITGRLEREGWALAPVVVATQARVAIGDEIGALIGAAQVAVLIGERPGLSAPDSLGVYLTWGPRVGRLDSDRNCISNIRDGGLAIEDAAATLAYLMSEARVRRLTGVALKDERSAPPLDPGVRAPSFLLPDRSR